MRIMTIVLFFEIILYIASGYAYADSANNKNKAATISLK